MDEICIFVPNNSSIYIWEAFSVSMLYFFPHTWIRNKDMKNTSKLGFVTLSDNDFADGHH